MVDPINANDRDYVATDNNPQFPVIDGVNGNNLVRLNQNEAGTQRNTEPLEVDNGNADSNFEIGRRFYWSLVPENEKKIPFVFSAEDVLGPSSNEDEYQNYGLRNYFNSLLSSGKDVRTADVGAGQALSDYDIAGLYHNQRHSYNGLKMESFHYALTDDEQASVDNLQDKVGDDRYSYHVGDFNQLSSSELTADHDLAYDNNGVFIYVDDPVKTLYRELSLLDEGALLYLYYDEEMYMWRATWTNPDGTTNRHVGNGENILGPGFMVVEFIEGKPRDIRNPDNYIDVTVDWFKDVIGADVVWHSGEDWESPEALYERNGISIRDDHSNELVVEDGFMIQYIDGYPHIKRTFDNAGDPVTDGTEIYDMAGVVLQKNEDDLQVPKLKALANIAGRPNLRVFERKEGQYLSDPDLSGTTIPNHLEFDENDFVFTTDPVLWDNDTTVSYYRYHEGVQAHLATNNLLPQFPDFDGDSSRVVNLSGSQFDDYLVGNDSPNVLSGHDGDDLLQGGKGADELIGGDGIDTADYSDSNNGVTVNLATGAASGGRATGDTLISIENLKGSASADHLTGDDEDNKIWGREERDNIKGGEGDDWISGGSHLDNMDGGEGGETEGDWVSYASSGDGVYVDLELEIANSQYDGILHSKSDAYDHNSRGWWGDETVKNFENIEGSAHQDRLVGDSFGNIFRPGDGADYVIGSSRHSSTRILHPDESADWVDYSDSPESVRVKLWDTENIYVYEGAFVDISGDPVEVSENFTGTIAHGGFANHDKLIGIENFIGSSLADHFEGDVGANVIKGGPGNDELWGNQQGRQSDGGNDTYIFAPGDDHDTIGDFTSHAKGNSDEVDKIDITHFDIEIQSQLYEIIGSADEKYRSSGDYVLDFGNGDRIELLGVMQGDISRKDFIVSDEAAATLDAVAILDGGLLQSPTGDSYDFGAKTISFLDENARVQVDLERGTLNGFLHDDLSGIRNVIGTTFMDDLIGDQHNNKLAGDLEADDLEGRGGNDELFGGPGHDLIIGGSGTDRIYGDEGNDDLIGGDLENNNLVPDGESDVFVIGDNTGHDVIEDFETGIDQIEIDITLSPDDVLDRINRALNNPLTNGRGETYIHLDLDPTVSVLIYLVDNIMPTVDDFVIAENVHELVPGQANDIELSIQGDTIVVPAGPDYTYESAGTAYVTGTLKYFDTRYDKIDISALGITREEMEERFENSWNGYGGGIHGEIQHHGDHSQIWINNDFSLSVWYWDKNHDGYNDAPITADSFIYAEDSPVLYAENSPVWPYQPENIYDDPVLGGRVPGPYRPEGDGFGW